MYFAGLSHSQGLESVAWLCSVGGLSYIIYQSKLKSDAASAKSGKLKPRNIPVRARVATAVHSSAFFIPMLGYITTTALNSFEQPEWLIDFSLPDEGISVRDKALARTAGAVAFVCFTKLAGLAFDHLGSQWAVIGIREKPHIVQSGPYRYVRHPLYSGVLGMELSCALMYWSYIPLYAFAITAAAFMVKMPVEERLVEDDIEVGLEYSHYKSLTTSRIIPYIW